MKVVAVTALALLLLGFFASYWAENASAKCNPGRSDDSDHYFDGMYRDSAQVDGTRAYISNYSPWGLP